MLPKLIKNYIYEPEPNESIESELDGMYEEIDDELFKEELKMLDELDRIDRSDD